MKKKLVSSILLLLIIFCAGCQKKDTKNNKDINNLKIEKKEKLKKCTTKEFYQGIAKEDWRELSIIQLTDDKITATISHYFLVLEKTKERYSICKIIDLQPYGMNAYYSEESTEFYPSKDGSKYLVYNECYINKKNQVILAKENKNLKSIFVDFSKNEVKYLKGNQFKNLKEENDISEKYLTKEGKASQELKKYADQKGCVIEETVQYKNRTVSVMKKAQEDSILKSKIYERVNEKITCVFELQ